MQFPIDMAKRNAYNEVRKRQGGDELRKLTMKAARALADMTQDDIADKMGVSRQCVSLWENGKNKISATQLEQFCEIVGVKMNEIFLPKKIA